MWLNAGSKDPDGSMPKSLVSAALGPCGRSVCVHTPSHGSQLQAIPGESGGEEEEAAEAEEAEAEAEEEEEGEEEEKNAVTGGNSKMDA